MKEFPKFNEPEEGKIWVAETFYSMQGEGKFIGTPAIFLRTQGCLLNCEWCDTYNVWKNGKLMTYDELIRLWKNSGWLNSTYNPIHIILTGGEPLARDKELNEFLRFFHTNYWKNEFLRLPFIEVETAGTVMPGELDCCVNQYNISPKLSNSGMSKDRRVRPDVINHFSKLSWDRDKSNTISFKFVVNGREDIEEAINTYIEPFTINTKNVYLMAEAATKKQLQERELSIIELAKEYGLKYSTRLHLHVWDKATGV